MNATPATLPPSDSESSTVTTLEDVRRVICKWLYFSDEDAEVIDIVLAGVYAIFLKGERLWLLIVGVPGSGKTELIRAFRGLTGCVKFISTLTPKTLASGYQNGEHSLLPKLDKKVLCIKDLTSIMDLPPEQQRQIFGTFRDAYDGFSDHARGNTEINSDSSFGLLAGVTNVIDLPRRIAEQELGDRYLKVRFHDENDAALERRAYENAGQEETMRKEIASAVHGFFASHKATRLPRPAYDAIASMAQFTAKMRTPVRRDNLHKIVSLPQSERPTRLMKQLASLIVCLAIVRGHEKVEQADIDTAWRVARDTVPPLRLRIYDAVRGLDKPVTAAVLSEKTRIPVTTVNTHAEDLWALGMFERQDSTVGDAITYSMAGVKNEPCFCQRAKEYSYIQKTY